MANEFGTGAVAELRRMAPNATKSHSGRRCLGLSFAILVAVWWFGAKPPLPNGQSHVDIRDAAPNASPSKKGVRYSIYSDTANFMEIEAVGGCPAVIKPGAEMSVAVSTRFSRT